MLSNIGTIEPPFNVHNVVNVSSLPEGCAPGVWPLSRVVTPIDTEP